MSSVYRLIFCLKSRKDRHRSGYCYQATITGLLIRNPYKNSLYRSFSAINYKKMIVYNYFTFPLICGNMKIVYFPAVSQPFQEYQL
ncbi:hypothetical protein DRX19_15330 [Salmonella enterica subsp. enterica]|nr:hypothetical protein [Salmonella enterica subsp. enterica serovar Pensacola]